MIRTTLYSLVVLALISLALAGDAAVQLSPRCGSFSTKSLDEKETADLIAHIMGLTPLHPKISRANFPAADIFARPNSNLLVTVDGIGTDILSQLVPSALRFFASSSSQVASLTQETATSRSSLASVMTLVTGETPLVHGIFGRTWTSPESPEELSAFNSAYSRVPSISDLLLTSLPESTVIAVSTDRQLASALSPHPQISTHDNTHVVYLDQTSGSFVSNSGVEQLSRQEILNSIQTASFLPSADAQLEFIDSSNIRVTLGSRVVASFDLSTAQDFGLFAELVAISKIIPSLITRKQNTLACDLISVGVASIRPLEERYGPGSSQVLAALYLMDAALSELSGHLEIVYEQQTTRQTLLLGTSVLAGNIKARSTRAVLDTLAATNSSTNTTYTPQQVADYQISIWGSVFIVIALFVPIYTFFNMDTSSDSILYRVAGPRLS